MSDYVDDLPLFKEAKARARNTDPTTSHLAAASVEYSGVAGSQRRVCLEAVLESPGITAAELADRIGIERHVPSRRLPELRDAGLIKNGTDRRCRKLGRITMTWEPA